MTPPLTAAGFESPSLSARGGGAGPAYELKFLLDEERGRAVEAWARRRLALDPHGDPALGGAYRHGGAGRLPPPAVLPPQ